MHLKSKREAEKRAKALRDKLEPVLQRNDLKQADTLLAELEQLDPEGQRWPHKRGDVLRRLNRTGEAIKCYERAAQLYSEQGFLPRAIAMAKLIAEIDPKRIELLARIDPTAARELHRRVRPEGVHAGDRTSTRRMQEQAIQLEPIAAAAKPTEASARQAKAMPKAAVAAATPAHEPAPAAAPPAPVATAGETATATPAPVSSRLARRLRRRANSTTIDIDLSDVELSPESMPITLHDSDLTQAADPDAEREACLPLLPLFAEAPKEALAQLARESELVRRGHGEIVIRRGDPADALFAIVEGAVRVHVAGLAPDAFPRLAAGDMFGEACLLSSEPRRADVVVEGELLALRIPKATLSYLARVHEGLADVLFELMTRRLVANLMHTSGLFAELGPSERQEVAAELELRRAPGGTDLLMLGGSADALLITITGHVEVTDKDSTEPRIEGAGVMFGHATLLDRRPSGIGVRARETLLALRLPREAFARVAMQHPAMLMRVSEMDELARVSQ